MSTSAAPSYSPGLEGVIAGESAICTVEPTLMYRGYPIDELAAGGVSFEAAAWLLLHGELPSDDQERAFRRTLAAEAHLPDAVVSMLRLMPAGAHPVDALRTGVSMLGALDPEADDPSHDANVRKAVCLIARTGALATSAWQVARGQEPVRAPAELGLSARFLYGITGRAPPAWQAQALDVVLILYAEHEFNASTFAARVTASTMSDIYSAVTSALGTLKGPLHGGANEAAMRMLREIGSADRAEAWVTERLRRREKIMGFGHRVYKTGDSRVPAVRELTRELGRRCGQPHWGQVCEALEAVMARAKGLCANLDLYAAPVLEMLGVPAELDVPVFAAARVAGWCAHVIEQHDHNRLIRPRCLYTGPVMRAVRRHGGDAGAPYPGTVRRDRPGKVVEPAPGAPVVVPPRPAQ